MKDEQKTFKQIICALGEYNQKKALDFLFTHHYTTIKNIQKLTGMTRTNSYLAVNRYEQRQLIKKIKFNDNGLSGNFIGLTLHGVYLHAETNNISVDESAVLYPANINLSSFNHNMSMQEIHLALNKIDPDMELMTERTYSSYNMQFKRKNKNGVIKNTIVPDAIAIFKNEKIAIEAELYPKNTDKYKSILSRHMHSASRGLYAKVLYAIPKSIYNSLSTRIKETAINVDKNSINKNSNIADRLIFMEL